MVTGERGKARDDVLAGLRRRGWGGRVVWAFAPVQDRHAAPAIAAALRELAAIEDVEVVIVARGGGSLADLFAFCDEALCRTVALLRVPVISSVGHHTDRTLIDDVAAVSCSTPTHAAEAAVPIDCRAARADVAAYARRLHGHGRSAILHRARALAHLSAPRAITSPATAVSCTSCCASCGPAAGARAPRGAVWPKPTCSCSGARPPRAATSDLTRRRTRLERLTLALAAHDPDRTLARGYAIVERPRRRAPGDRRGGARGAEICAFASTTASFRPG